MTTSSFILASGAERVAHAVSIDGGHTWSSASFEVLRGEPVGKLVVGVDRETGEIWISTARNQMRGDTCGLPPSRLDLDGGLRWGAATPGANIAVILHLRDPPATSGQLSYPVAFHDGRPVDPEGQDVVLELDCPFFVGMKLLLAGLPLREVGDEVRMKGDLLAVSVLVGAVARIDVLDSHRWLQGSLAVAGHTRLAWEPAVVELVMATTGKGLRQG